MSPTAGRLSVMMFLQYFVWGAWYVTVANFMGVNGMEKSIGNAFSVMPIAAILSPFFLGMVADRFFATERILGILHLAGGLLLLLAPQVAKQGAEAFVGLLMIYALCYAPTLGLSNSLAFSHIQDQEKEFPKLRVLGTIGWIAANVVVSYILKADTSDIQFYVAGGSSLLLGLYSFSLPHTPPPSAGRAVKPSDLLGLESLTLMKSPNFAIFIVSSFLICIPLQAYYAFAPVFAKDAGIIENTAAWMSLGQVSEIFFMLVMPLFFLRLGVKWMLFVGMLAWVVRYGLFGLAAPAPGIEIAQQTLNPLVLGGILLHGICYDFFFVTGQIYVDKKAGAAIRGAAQGFLVLVTQGVGGLIGAQVSQTVVNMNTSGGSENWQPIWFTAAAAAGLVMVVFGLLFRDDARPVSDGDVARGEMEVVSA